MFPSVFPSPHLKPPLPPQSMFTQKATGYFFVCVKRGSQSVLLEQFQMYRHTHTHDPRRSKYTHVKFSVLA